VGDVGSEKGEALKEITNVERVAFWTASDGEGLFILTGGKKTGTDGQPRQRTQACCGT
jgi:hypothetical protein